LSSRCSHGVVDLVQSMCVIDLVSEDPDQFRSSMAMTIIMGRSRVHARRLFDCHQQRQAGSGMRPVTVALRWLTLAVVVR
jgi:hypothetical protein